MKDKTIDSLCKISKKCSGCQLNSLEYDEQLRVKQSRINKLFLGLCKPESIVPAENYLRYRNKASAVFVQDRNKNIRWGIYQSASGGFCAAEKCFLQPEIADNIFSTVASLIKSCKLKLYNKETKSGLIRSALIRYSESTGQLLLVIVTTDEEFRKEKSFVNALVKKHPEITGIVRSYYEGDAVLMTGEKEEVLFGSGYIEDIMLGCRFKVSAHSFYQINSSQTAKLYKKAIDLASLNGEKTFLDAYCGTGTIGIIASKTAKSGAGVELNPVSVENAKENAVINSAENMEFFCLDAGEYLKSNAGKYDVVFTDPPRAGCSKEFLSSLVNSKPERIVYISCNPQTQVRDIRFLIKNGYKIKKAVPFDLFPQTSHVETVVALTCDSMDI